MLSLSPSVRSSLVGALGLASICSASVAAPLNINLDPAMAGRKGPDQPIQIWGGEGRGGGPAYRFLPRLGGGHWGGGGGHWGRGWHNGGWRHGGWGGWGSGWALGLGLGLPLGYYGGYAPYYDNYYPSYSDEPVYRPRVYRSPRYYAPRHYYQNYNSYNGYYQCDNLYQTGPVHNACR